MTELDRCPTCQHKVMFHGERGCSRFSRVDKITPGIRGRSTVASTSYFCFCSTTRRQLLEQDAA